MVGGKPLGLTSIRRYIGARLFDSDRGEEHLKK
jgi:hypothetical protein